jgi:hypothetical protein
MKMYNIHLSRCESCGASPGEKHNLMCETMRCNYCKGDIRIRNPTGRCDHLYYPNHANPNYPKPRQDTGGFMEWQRKLNQLEAYEGDKMAEQITHNKISKIKESEHIANEEAMRYILSKNPNSLQEAFTIYLTGLALAKICKAGMINLYKIEPETFALIEKAVIK